MADFAFRISDFRGVAQDQPAGALAPGLFQIDQGGDLFLRGAWRPRRGQTRLGLDPFGSAIRTFFTFETPPGSLSIVVIDDNGNFRGYASVTSSGVAVPEPDLAGWGVGGAGEGGAGV